MVAALFVIKLAINLYVEMYVLETNKLKMHTHRGAKKVRLIILSRSYSKYLVDGIK